MAKLIEAIWRILEAIDAFVMNDADKPERF